MGDGRWVVDIILGMGALLHYCCEHDADGSSRANRLSNLLVLKKPKIDPSCSHIRGRQHAGCRKEDAFDGRGRRPTWFLSRRNPLAMARRLVELEIINPSKPRPNRDDYDPDEYKEELKDWQDEENKRTKRLVTDL